MAMADDTLAEPCRQHDCCIRVPRVEASSGFSHLAGEWHLRWMADDRAWFLVPPQGNVREIRVAEDGDPTAVLAVDGVGLDEVRHAIDQGGLFPPC
jgi:hypothetical protein